MKRLLVLAAFVAAILVPSASPAVRGQVCGGQCDGGGGLGRCNYPTDWYRTVGGHTYVCLPDGYWH